MIEKDDFFGIEDIDVALMLQKTDRILSENKGINIDILQQQEIAASIPKKHSILLNFNSIKNIQSLNNIFDYFMMIKGLNYHELSHILFTEYSVGKIDKFIDRKNVDFNLKTKRLLVKNIFYDILNILEDGRIESLFYSYYPKSKYYFTFCANKLIVVGMKDIPKNSKDIICWVSNYLLLYGRKFMCWDKNFKKEISKIRKKVVKILYLLGSNSEKYLNLAEKIVDEYIKEVDLNERFELAYALYMLFYKLENNGIFKIPNSSSHISLINGSRKINKERIKEGIKTLEIQEKKGDEEGEEIEGEEGEEIEGEEGEEIEGEEGEEIEGIEERINNVINRSKLISEEIKEDITVILKTSNEDRGEEDLMGKQFKPRKREIIEAVKVEKILKEIRGDLSVNVHKFQKRGKIDINSAMKANHNGNMNIFKRKRINKIDKSKLGVCLILDSSGSILNRDFDNEIKAIWVLNKALEKLGNKVEIIEFSSFSEQRILKSFNGKGDWKRMYAGGTSIIPPLKMAINNLNDLRKTKNIDNLFIIIISDGDFEEFWGFNGYGKLKEIFNTIKRSKIKTLWIFASEHSRRVNNKCDVAKLFDWYFKIDNLSDLSIKLKNIIKMIQKEIVQKIYNINGFYG